MAVNEIKSDFPFFENNAECVYLDGAATSQKPKCVIAALTDFYNKCNSNISRGEYPLADNASRMFEAARERVASFFGASSDCVAFVQNATDALNIAAETLGNGLSAGQNVVVSPLEHNSALLPLMRICERTGAELRYIPLLDDGSPDIRAIWSVVDKNTAFASFTAGSNVNGYRAPLEEVCAEFDRYGVQLIIDATQAAPHEKINVSNLKFDYMCLSAHKLYGPAGVGVIIDGRGGKRTAVSRIGGGSVVEADSHGYVLKSGLASIEAGTPNAAGVVAFGAAIDYISSLDLDSLWKNEMRLADVLRRELKDMGAKVACGGENPLPVVSFDPMFIHPLDAARLLGAMGICVRSGRHCAHAATKMLGLGSTLRVSLGIYNDDEDVSAFVSAMKKLKARYGNV